MSKSCYYCGSVNIVKTHGHHNGSEHRFRHQCKGCGRYSDDLTGSVLIGHHQPLECNPKKSAIQVQTPRQNPYLNFSRYLCKLFTEKKRSTVDS